jgi:hypothetical protein
MSLQKALGVVSLGTGADALAAAGAGVALGAAALVGCGDTVRATWPTLPGTEANTEAGITAQNAASAPTTSPFKLKRLGSPPDSLRQNMLFMMPRNL